MRIVGSNVVMASQHSRSETHVRTESLRIRVGAEQGPPRREGTTGPKLQPRASAAQTTDEPPDQNLSRQDRVRIMILERVLGLKVKLVTRLDREENPEGTDAAVPTPPGPAAQPQGPEWSVAYDLHESHQEAEQLSVAANGIIKTADGREIAFAVQLNMSRQFSEEHHVSFRAGSARLKDPIVINYAGPAAELTERTFRFDLDMDGSPDQMPVLGAGSGFLALDRDGDGKVSSGAELFGPTVGDGFAEMRQWDADANGWLDAGDPVWERLRIWTTDAQGNHLLFSLAQKGIGAIFLGSISAQYALKDAQNQTLGQNQKAGLFIREEGTAGTVQQLDVKV